MKCRALTQKTALILASVALLNATHADARNAINVVQSGKTAPMTATSTRYLAVAVRNDEKLDKLLLNAAKAGKVEEAIAILQNGANPNVADKGGLTALMWASQNGKPDLVRALLQMGANANAVNKKGQTALYLAMTIGAAKKKKKFGNLGGMLGGAVADNVLGGGLGNYGADAAWASTLLGSGGLDDLLGNNLKALLNDAAFDLRGKNGWKAVIGTALQGDLKSDGAYGMQRLLSGSRLDAKGWINLMGAVKGSNGDVLRAISHIDGARSAQWAQFVDVASRGDVRAVTNLMNDAQMRLLLAQATQGFLSASGELPANAAKTIVSSLLQKGANAATLDKDGRTALQLAQARGWNDVAALLQR